LQLVDKKSENELKTVLYDKHLELEAKMVDFAGFDMPIQYKNLKEEVQAVRESVGVFDVSHMGEFFVSGEEAVKFVDYIMTNDFANLPVGKAIYSPLCNTEGRILDDLIAYKISEDKTLICVNAANIEKDFNWIKNFAKDFKVELDNKSDDYSLLAVQGPKTFETLKQVKSLENIQDADYYSVQTLDNFILARTGYTGEDGFEIFADHQSILKLWDELIELGVKPCGLGARDVLRLEVCFPLYGNELSEELTPLDCGLKWTTKLNKESFVGKDALAKHSPKYKLVKLLLDKGIPRTGYKVYAGEQEIGKITSGSQSVILSKGIALARVQKDAQLDEQDLFVEIRNKKYNATKVNKPFVVGGHK
jgi:aminomethyltransferase